MSDVINEESEKHRDILVVNVLDSYMNLTLKGSSINHVVKFLGIFDIPPFPSSWLILLNKAYVMKWSFG